MASVMETGECIDNPVQKLKKVLLFSNASNQLLIGSKPADDWAGGRWSVVMSVSRKDVDDLLKCISFNKEYHQPTMDMLLRYGQLPSIECKEKSIIVLVLLSSFGPAELTTLAYKTMEGLLTQLCDICLVVHAQSVCTDRKGKGFGRALRSFLKRVYLKHSPEQLVNEFTSRVGMYGWKHKDIVKLLHMKPPTDEYNAVFHYIMFGLKPTTRKYENEGSDRCLRILKRLQAISLFKSVKDIKVALAVNDKYPMLYHHFQPHMLKWPEMWPLVVEVMEPIQLLDSLPDIGHRGLYSEQHKELEKALCSRLSDTALLQKKGVTAAAVYIAERRLAQRGRAEYVTKSKAKLTELDWQRRGAQLNAYQPPMAVRQTLKRVSQLLVRQRKPLGQKICVVTDMRSEMGSTRCGGCHNLSAMQAASLINVHLKTEEQAVFINFNNDQVCPWFLKLEDMTLGQVAESLKSVKPKDGQFSVEALLQWAADNDESFDACICISSSEVSLPSSDCTRKPGFKLVIVYVTDSVSPSSTETSMDNTMVVHGFDATVPLLIDLFLSAWY